jgi:ABC-type Mn2+/Zn2+ transport system ATPase subunit
MHRCREGHGWPGAASYINRECLGLIGPNGAGKSTPLKMLNGLHS